MSGADSFSHGSAELQPTVVALPMVFNLPVPFAPRVALKELESILQRDAYPGAPPDVTEEEARMLWTLHALQNTRLIDTASKHYYLLTSGKVSLACGIFAAGMLTIPALAETIGQASKVSFSETVQNVAICASLFAFGVVLFFLRKKVTPSQTLVRALSSSSEFWPGHMYRALGKLVDAKLTPHPVFAVLLNALKGAHDSDRSKAIAVATFHSLMPQDVVGLLRLPDSLLSALPTPERPRVVLALDGDTEELLHRTLTAMGHDPVQAIEHLTSMVTCTI